MIPFKYTLIVSQYYWSIHTMVIHRPEKFRDTALNFVEDLQNFKRSEEEKQRPIRLGDLGQNYFRENDRRQNINDSGDIYFIHSDNLDALSSMEKRVREECTFTKDRFDKRTNAYKKAIIDIEKHHDKNEFEKLINEHFKWKVE